VIAGRQPVRELDLKKKTKKNKKKKKKKGFGLFNFRFKLDRVMLSHHEHAPYGL